MALVLDDPFDSRNQLYSPPGDMVLPQGTIHVASLSLRMYQPQKAQPFIRLFQWFSFQQLFRTYLLILNQAVPYKTVLRECGVLNRDQLPGLWEWKPSSESHMHLKGILGRSLHWDLRYFTTWLVITHRDTFTLRTGTCIF